MLTYDDLTSNAILASYAGNRDLQDQMPRLVRRAQEYVELRMDHDLFADTAFDITVSEDGMVTDDHLPERFLEIRSLAVHGPVGRHYFLLPRGEAMLAQLFASGSRGEPQYYARMRHREYRVYPQPYRPVTLRMQCNVRPDRLGPDVQKNLITDQFPDIMEYALLREVAIFNVDESLLKMYTDELQGRLEAANTQVSRLTRDETAERPVETRNVTGR
jgi:hypothetical protein